MKDSTEEVWKELRNAIKEKDRKWKKVAGRKQRLHTFELRSSKTAFAAKGQSGWKQHGRACCHVLLSRMSSRPMGRSGKGAANIAQLQAYYYNGKDMMELVRYQKKEKPQQREQKKTPY